jgi:hypothetical protein
MVKKATLLFAALALLAVAGAMIARDLLATSPDRPPAPAPQGEGPPALPASFYGVVGGETSSGEVAAWIASVRVAAVQTQLHEGEVVYALDVPADDESTPEREGGRQGERVTFTVGGVNAVQNPTWQSGTALRVDLTLEEFTIYLPLLMR